MPTVLVTGALGYIGRVLCQKLIQLQYNVIAVDNRLYDQKVPSYLPHNPCHGTYEFHHLDVAESTCKLAYLVNRADVVIPLAALVGAPVCNSFPELAKEVNQDAIELLIPMMKREQQLIYPTTNSGYGATTGEVECTEETPLTPLSIYGVTKAKAEEAVLNYPFGTSFRLATVFGYSPRMRLDLMVNDFAFKCYFDHKLELFEPYFKRNFVHIQDVVDTFISVIDNTRIYGQIYNLGNDLINDTKLGLAHTIASHPLFTADITIGTGEDPDKRNYIVSSSKLNRDTGIRCTRDIHYGLNELAILFDQLNNNADFKNLIGRMRNK